ncbi:MAG: cation diffusion facilitator family transporter, partial [Campylobacterota bacterium]|nr:cation diffusion facilitator family transporter [Campylobacterota bacterium]
ATQKIMNDHPTELLMTSIYVMIASIVITVALVLFLNYVANKNNNLVIKADALHYKTDLYSNAAVLLALVLIHLTGYNIIDAILGITIAIYMVYSAIPILKEGVLMLLDAALSPEEVQEIETILNKNETINGYHFLQTRQSGSDVFVSVHVVFDTGISLYDAHVVGDKLELQIKKLFDKKQVHVLMHLDPYDDSQINSDEDEHHH